MKTIDQKTCQAILEQALERRAGWGLPSAGVTDCFRLLDGLSDGLKGVEMEVFGPHWVLGTRDVPWPQGMEQVALACGAKSLWHKQLRSEEKGELLWKAGEQISEAFVVLENGARFEISLQAGYSQGLFLDQRLNRRRVQELVVRQAQELGRAPKVLNTFAYTGGFSVMAALGGAQTTTLDLSQPYLDWAKRNFLLNGLNPEEHGWIRGDALDWLQRWAQKGAHRFEGIVLDPPTFGRHSGKGGRGGKGGKAGKQTWSVERDLPELLAAAQALLSEGGWILLSTNCRSLTPQRFGKLLRESAAKLRWKQQQMPPEFTGEAYLQSAWAEMG